MSSSRGASAAARALLSRASAPALRSLEEVSSAARLGTVAAGAEWAAFSPWRRAWFPWTRSYRPGGAPASAIRRVGVPRIRPEGEKPESRGHRAERLHRARIRHEVKMAREKAREEVESEAWVKERARLENLANSSRLTHHAVALDPDATVPERDQRCVRVGVVGVPNAGKSQLVNTLVGAQISAVSAKTNTTRVETLGAVTRGDAQAVLLDLPGVVGPEHYRNPTHATKVSSAWAAAAQCDLLLFIVDANRQARRPDPRVVDLLASARANLERLKYTEVTGLSMPPAVLALNKVDLFRGAEDREALKRVARALAAVHPFEDIFPISAAKGRGTDALLSHLLLRAPLRPWDLPPSAVTDKSMVDQAIEVVRESVYRRLHQELPYSIVPVHDSWTNFDDGSYRIEQTLVVDSVPMKQIVVGTRGSVIGQIGIRARTVLEKMFSRRVHLVLNVKVRKKNNSLRGKARTTEFELY